jgi:hypothetical protein
MPFSEWDAPASKRPRAQGYVVVGELRNPKQRCVGEMVQGGKHRGTAQYLNKVKRNADPLCTFRCHLLGFVASDVAP